MSIKVSHPQITELEEAMGVLYLSFQEEFDFLFGNDFKYGKKLFTSFYKRMIKLKDLQKFLVAKIKGKIVATANIDFENPHIIKFIFYFLKLNLHFLRSYTKIGIKRAIKTTLSMYWFFFEDFRRNSCYINLFGVHPKYQHRGIGTKLLKAVEIFAQKKHLASMSLDVAYEDRPARHLYEKMGFKSIRRIQNPLLKSLNGIEGVFSMEKRLIPLKLVPQK